MAEPQATAAVDVARAAADADRAALVPPPPPVEPPPPSATALASAIDDAWRTWMLRHQRTPLPHASVYASAWRTCERRMVYELIAPDQQPPTDAALIARFRRGDDRERDLLADLARIGRDAVPAFDVRGQQERFELRDHKGRIAITGKVDARLRVHGTRYAAPLEVKAWAPHIVDRIESFADLFDQPWTRGGAYQLLSYLYGAAEPFGFLLLDRSGLPLVLPVELDAHLDRMEDFLQRAERVIDHAAAGTLPDFITDAGECKRCPFFGTVCQPPLLATGTRVLIDPELEATLERWHTLQPAGREWNELDDQIKRRLRGTESAVLGHFSITGRWTKASRVEVPAQLRPQFTVTQERGRFTLTVERL